uniref:Vacuolar protein sorting-associated protein 13B-like n=1 Tax=Saccoglossus kowalevskii TaxID=10224 RepID=A0ABM0M3N8_SACKO
STVEFFIGNNRSQPVLLLKEALSPRGRYDLLTKADGVLPLEGSTHVSIACDGKPSRLCYLTLLSTVKHGVRVITIKDRYIFVNKSKEDLSLRTVAIVDSDTKFDKSSLVPKIQMVPASQSDSSASVQAIEFWDVPRYDQSPPSMNHVQYLSFTFANIGTSKKSWRNWTQFVPIDTKLPRHSVAMPIRNVDQSNGSIDRKDPLAYVVTVMEANGVVYIMVDVNPMPRIIIHNNCSFPLHYGQGLIQDCTEEMVTVVEEQDMLSPLPLVEAHRSTCYEFPHVQSQFPQFNNQNQIQPKLHICIARDLDTVYLKQEEKVEQWSDEINIGEFGGQRSEIMILSHGGYVFVNSRTVGACTHVFIEELSMEGQTGQRSKLGVPSLLRQETEAESPMDITIEGSVMASRVCFVLMDELHNRVSSTEVLRFMMDDVHLAYFPLVKPDHPTTMQQGVQFAVRTAQIDNQLFQQGAFDFPVLLMAQHKIPSRDESEFAVLPISAASEHSYQTSIFAVRLIFEMDQFRSVSCLHDVTVSVKPLTLFMEDQFIYQMVRVISSYKIPHELKQPIKSKFPKSGDQLEPMRWKDVPAEAKSLSLALINPLAVNHLRIKPLTILASAHASLKVYLASDHTSLSFGQFRCGPVFTTTRQLVQCLTMHYASGALFKAVEHVCIGMSSSEKIRHSVFYVAWVHTSVLCISMDTVRTAVERQSKNW